MSTVIINIPESVNSKAFDFTIYVAAKMYEDSLITSGQAAEMVGLSKRAFIEVIGKCGVSLFNNSIEELKKDIANA